MKKIIILLTLTLTLFASDACKLDVYFGHGVWNDENSAIESRNKLREFVQNHNPSRFPIDEEGITYSFKYAHNETYGYVNDLIETYWQLYTSGQISEAYFSFVTKALDGIDNTNPDEEAFRERIRNIINQYNLDISKMLQIYRDSSFSNNNNVLLVAHSQGNLFANDAYNFLTDNEKNRFQVVGVGVPANHIVTGNNYVTFTFDYVIQAVSGHLPANVSGFGHTFVNSYLDEGNTDATIAIATHINNKVALLDQNICTKYKYFRWIAYMCPSRSDTELEVGIYGSKVINSSGMTKEELVTSDTKDRVALNSSGNCPLSGWDYRTGVSVYDKNGCSAYTFDDTSGGYHSLDYIASTKYENSYTCTTYEMSNGVYETLKNLEE